MTLVVDANHLGPDEAAWIPALESRDIPPMGDLHARRVVLVSPHPDDEIFGAAGLIQTVLAQHIPLEIIAVTDGEGSHPDSKSGHAFGITTRRSQETWTALQRLGLTDPSITRLGLADGGVTENCERLGGALRELLLPNDLCVAPWRHDGHPDHDACGRVATAASRSVGCRLLSYLVWAWHWADPDGSDIPWDQCRRLELTHRATARKRWATAAFRSQTQPLSTEAGDGAVLPPAVLRRFWRHFEIFVDDSDESNDIN
jgi:LmbE family N-acetylglucosaminyl deacetylase